MGPQEEDEDEEQMKNGMGRCHILLIFSVSLLPSLSFPLEVLDGIVVRCLDLKEHPSFSLVI